MSKIELLKSILGTADYVNFVANLFWAYLGSFVMILLLTNNRNPSSPRTPVQFSWSFFWSDNFRKIVATFILIFVAVRFGIEFLTPYIPSGTSINSFTFFLVGLGCDRLAQLFKDRNIFGIGNSTK